MARQYLKLGRNQPLRAALCCRGRFLEFVRCDSCGRIVGCLSFKILDRMNRDIAQSGRPVRRAVAGLLAIMVVAAPVWAEPAVEPAPDSATPRGGEAPFSVAASAGREGARLAMPKVQLRGRWMPLANALALCRQSVADGDVDDDVLTCLDELLSATASADQKQQVRSVQAYAAVCARQFQLAALLLDDLAETAPDDQCPALEAAAEILAEHPDGIYLVTPEHLVGTALLGDVEAILPPGPSSLADPTVLRIALRDKAGEALDMGVRIMKQAQQVRPADPEKAERLCSEAVSYFGWADAVTDGIARSYRIETARLQIAMIRSRIEADAVRFDAELTAIGQHDLAVGEYLARLERMAECLRMVQHDLDTILDLAGSYRQEFAVAIRWAQTDKQRIGRMQITLAQELDAAH